MLLDVNYKIFFYYSGARITRAITHFKIFFRCSDVEEEDLVKITSTYKLQEDRGGNRLMARRRCRIDFERNSLGDLNPSFAINNDISRLIGKEASEIKDDETDVGIESNNKGNEYHRLFANIRIIEYPLHH